MKFNATIIAIVAPCLHLSAAAGLRLRSGAGEDCQSILGIKKNWNGCPCHNGKEYSSDGYWCDPKWGGGSEAKWTGFCCNGGHFHQNCGDGFHCNNKYCMANDRYTQADGRVQLCWTRLGEWDVWHAVDNIPRDKVSDAEIERCNCGAGRTSTKNWPGLCHEDDADRWLMIVKADPGGKDKC